jgi:hypothetical protein
MCGGCFSERRQLLDAAVAMQDAMRLQQQQWHIAFRGNGSRQTVKNPLNPRAMWQRSRRLGQQAADGRRVASQQGDQGDVEYIACRGQQPRHSSFPLCMYGICNMTAPSQLAGRALSSCTTGLICTGCVAALCATIIRLVHHPSSAPMVVCGQDSCVHGDKEQHACRALLLSPANFCISAFAADM